MKSIVFNKQQLEAYKNGATMFLVPVDKEIYSIQGNFIEFQGVDGASDVDSVEEFINHASDIQKNENFFIQEEFTLDEILLGGEEILYKNDFLPRDFKSSAIGYGLTTDKMKERILKRCSWQEASQMQEHQARFKDIVLDAEVKRVQDICNSTAVKIHNINIRPKYHLEYWLKKQGIDYDENPYIFLYTIRGIN